MARLRRRSKSSRSRAILGASQPSEPVTPEQASANTAADAAAADFVAAIDRVLGDVRHKAKVEASAPDLREHGTREALEFADLVESLLPQASTPEGLEQPNILEIVRARRIATRVSRAATVPVSASHSEGAATAQSPTPTPPVQRDVWIAATPDRTRRSLRVLAAAAVLLLTIGSSVLVWQRTRDVEPSSTEPAPTVAFSAITPAPVADVVPEARPSAAFGEAAEKASADSTSGKLLGQPIRSSASNVPATRNATAPKTSRNSEAPIEPTAADARAGSAAAVSLSLPRERAEEPASAIARSTEPAPAAASPAASDVATLPAASAAGDRAAADDERLTDAARERAVQRVVSAYERAYDSRSVSAVAEIWPSLDTVGFSRAFDGVREQDLSFDQCIYTVEDARAVARCPGRVRYVGRVGRANPQVREAVWTITMARVNDDWQMAGLSVR